MLKIVNMNGNILQRYFTHNRVPTRFGKVWKSMEFDLSNFQVWKSMEKINQSMEKYLCFQTIVPIVF